MLATAAAVTAANVYLSQPLLASLARSFEAGPDLLGAVPMATQLGYAAGILLLVPAGDSGDRRRLILRLGAASTVALVACASAPTVRWLIMASFALGLLSPSRSWWRRSPSRWPRQAKTAGPAGPAAARARVAGSSAPCKAGC